MALLEPVGNIGTRRTHRIVDACGGRRSLRMLVVVTVISLIVLAGIFDLVGTDRAVTACSADPPDRTTSLATATRELAWSFSPPGFECRFVDKSGEVLGRTHLGLWP